jgi:hypothetical protein
MAKLRSHARPKQECRAPVRWEPSPDKQGDQRGTADSPGVYHSATNAATQLKLSKKVKGATKSNGATKKEEGFGQ